MVNRLMLAVLLLVGVVSAQTYTTNLALTKPTHGQMGWDTAFNGDLDAIDALFSGGSGKLDPARVPDLGAVYLTVASFTRANVVALWTACSSGYLKYDGTCSSPAGLSVTGSSGDLQTNNGAGALGSVAQSVFALAAHTHSHTFTRACELHIWGTGTSGVLQDTDDEAVSCKNKFGVTETVTAVECYADAGSPTVLPAVSGGSNLLSGNLTCGTASWASGTLNGTPTLTSNSTIDANIVSAGGTAKTIRIVITLTHSETI